MIWLAFLIGCEVTVNGDKVVLDPLPGDAELCADPVEMYFDGDGDGWGDELLAALRCEAGLGFVEPVGDCDDLDPAVHPFAPEVCDNGKDDDCDGPNGTWDGLIDCADPDCSADPRCLGTGTGTGTGSGTGTGTGSVTGPEIDVTPISHDFGMVAPYGAGADVQITVSNRGNAPLTVSAVTEADGGDGDRGWYTVSTNLPAVIPSSGSEVVTVNCNPPFYGYYYTDLHQLVITSDDADEGTVRVSLSCQNFPG